MKARLDNDPDAVIATLRGSSAAVSLRLMEAVELLVHMLKCTGQPEAELAALTVGGAKAEGRTE